MKKVIVNSSMKSVANSFLTDYEKIVNPSERAMFVEREWVKQGDYFQKLSLYDNSYRPLQSLGNTTLIKGS